MERAKIDMAELLISFCNQLPNAHGAVAIYDTSSESCDWLRIDKNKAVSGVGLYISQNTIFCACTDGERSYLAIVDKRDYAVRDVVRLVGIMDVHSICVDGNDLIAASTGRDEVVRVAADGGGPTETLWAATSTGADTHHVNSIVQANGTLLVSAFGPRMGSRWSSAVDGYIYDVGASKAILRGLLQPHSLVVRNEKVVFCESACQSIRDLDGAMRYLDGYARGIAFDNTGNLYVGSSVGRRDATLPGMVMNPSEDGPTAGRCELIVLPEQEGLASKAFDLAHLGAEIYDVRVLSA